MQRLFHGWLRGAALAGCLAVGLSKASAQSAFEVDTFPFGLAAGTVAVSERTGRLYFTPGPFADGNTRRDFVTVFDGETHALLAPLFFDGDAVVGDVAIHPANGRIYVSLFNESAVAVVEEATGRIVTKIPVQSQPLAMALDPAFNRLYVAHHDSLALSTINTLTETAATPMIGPELVANQPRATPAGLAVDPRTGQVFHRVILTESGSAALVLLDGSQPGTLRASRVIGSASGQVAFNPSTGTGYLALEESGQLQVFTGGNTLATNSPIDLGAVRPHGLALDRTTSRLYVTDAGGTQVAIFDVSLSNALRPALREIVTVGNRPRAIAVNSLTGRAYVINTESRSISLIRDRRLTLPLPVVSAEPNVASGQWTNRVVTLSLSLPQILVGGRRPELVFQSLGTLEIPRSQVSVTPITIRFSGEGSSTLHFATRAGGNVLVSEPDPSIHLSLPGSFQVRIDNTPPVATLGTFDRRRWFGAGEVVVTGTSTDALSGLADPTSDATFALRADGREGEEIADGQTDARTILDLAGNSVTAGPITGIRIDRKAPTLTVQSPAENASFFLNQRVVARFSARDGGSGLREVRGLFLTGDVIANGGRLLTGRVGRGQPFVVLAVDNVGNQSDSQRTYTVRYRIRRIDNGTFRLPGNLAWKLQLQDAARKNQSASEIPVVALRIEPVSGGAATEIHQRFIYNPTLGGRGGGYELALSFRSLPRGAYRLVFTADGVEHEARFTVR